MPKKSVLFSSANIETSLKQEKCFWEAKLLNKSEFSEVSFLTNTFVFVREIEWKQNNSDKQAVTSSFHSFSSSSSSSPLEPTLGPRVCERPTVVVQGWETGSTNRELFLVELEWFKSYGIAWIHRKRLDTFQNGADKSALFLPPSVSLLLP